MAAALPFLPYLAAAAAITSAYGSYQMGKMKKDQYQLQAQMSTIEGERKQIQYRQRANDVLRRRNQANAALTARAAAGGVDPFSGSPDIVATINNTAAGREYAMLLADADAAMRGGVLQAQLYQQAGEMAKRAGTFDAISKLGSAALMAGGSGGTQAPAPITDRSVYA